MGLRSLITQIKALVFPKTIGWGHLLTGLPNTAYPYAADVQDGLTSSVVTPIVQWIMRVFPEAPLVVRERLEDKSEIVENHPLTQLIGRPNEAYPGTLLWMTTLTDWCWYGESYWRIISNGGGRPEELWWMPPWSCEPKWPQDGSAFISHYDYHPDIGLSVRLELDEVLHFRHGLDPRNPRHGLPPLRAIIRDIWSDDESSNLVATLLRNTGIPGIIVSPRMQEGSISPEDVERVKAYIHSRFMGDHRGEPLVFGQPTSVERLAWSPDELAISSVRQNAEERVSAALGISAAVVGYRAGLENSKVGATMHEFVRLSWNNGIIPLQRLLADELQRVLLPAFEPDPDAFEVGWNYDEVQALQEDQNALAERYERLWLSGLLKKSECRQALGYESTPEDEIYWHPHSGSPVDPADQMSEPEPQPAPLAPFGQGPAQNGHGNRNGPPVEQRALRLKQGTLEEFVTSIIRRNAQRVETPPAQLTKLANRIWREEQKLSPQFQRRLTTALEHYGSLVATASREVLQRKQSLEDIMATSIITERVPLAVVRVELGEVYQAMYEAMGAQTLTLIEEAMDVPPTDPARIQAMLNMQVRERVALLDLPAESRTEILRVLEQARTAGLTEEAMIQRLQEEVPAGRWRSVEIRAQILARSESRFASNLATSEYARQTGSRLLVFDARLGATDQTCEERNGWIIHASEAAALSATEHPNGTLGFAPLAASAVQA